MPCSAVRFVVAAAGLCLAAPLSAQPDREVLNPPGLAPLVPAYSVAIRDGEWVFVSGMTGIKPGTQDIVEGGIAVQTRQTMENIRTALYSGGATMADVAECTVYLRDMADYAAMNREYMAFFPRNPPARATLAVSALPRPAALVEVKCSARRRTTDSPARARRFEESLALEDSGYTSASASVGDVNGDGHLDIVLVKGRHWPLRNLVLTGNGGGTFARAYAVDSLPDRSYSGILVDVTGDGALDLVVSNDDPDAKKIYRNDGAGRFTLLTTFGSPTWSTRHVAVGDVNGDAIPDIVLANRNSRRATASYLCLGLGGGRIDEPCREISQGSATTITLADVNGDRALDLIVPHRDGGQGYVLVNNGRGDFTTRIPFGPARATYRSAYAADFDGDGRMDLAAIDELGSAVLLHGRNGGFDDATPLGPDGQHPYALALADVDMDGRVDVIAGYTRARPVVYFNDGARRFTAVPFGDAKGTAYGFAVGDLNEDGVPDIVMARTDAPNMVFWGGR